MCFTRVWTQPLYNDKNLFTFVDFYLIHKNLIILDYQAVLILWAVWRHTAQAPPTTADGLSRISIFPPLRKLSEDAVDSFCFGW